jgi:hypothetical protein
MGITVVACKDDDETGPSLRSKKYNLSKSATDAAKIGDVTVSENADSSVNLTITLDKTEKDVKHPFFVIYGTTAAPSTDTLRIDSIAGTGNAVTKVIFEKVSSVGTGDDKRKFNYDSAVALNAFAKVFYSAHKDSVIAIGNILHAAN